MKHKGFPQLYACSFVNKYTLKAKLRVCESSCTHASAKSVERCGTGLLQVSYRQLAFHMCKTILSTKQKAGSTAECGQICQACRMGKLQFVQLWQSSRQWAVRQTLPF
jgi:hypothetical protein